MYLSGRTAEFFYNPDVFGCIFSYRQTGKQFVALENGCRWMLDNGAFSGKFVFQQWLKNMDRMMKYQHNCLGIICPDSVFLNANGQFVKGDWERTLENLNRYRDFIVDRGFPVSYVLQDDHPPHLIPYDLFDCLFVGGTTLWKLSYSVESIARVARRNKKYIHVGRVNSVKRMKQCYWADSYDGNHAKYEGGFFSCISKILTIFCKSREIIFSTSITLIFGWVSAPIDTDTHFLFFYYCL